MHLDIESLRVLLAVLDHGGMTKAAKRLNMGQSAVSRKVQRLEDRVGRPLLIRDGHALRPTRDGRALLNDARTMVELHDRAVAKLQSSELTGHVKLSCNGEVDASQIASLLGTFKLRHPRATVEFTLDHSGSLVDLVDSGEIDLAIFQAIPSRTRPDDIALWTDTLSWVAAEGCLFRHEPVPIIDFGAHCYYNDFTHKTLTAAKIKHRSVFSATSSRDVRAAVQAGIGIAAMSSRYVGGDIVEWRPPVALEPLPAVTQIVRAVPGERSEAVATLIATIQSELTGAPQIN